MSEDTVEEAFAQYGEAGNLCVARMRYNAELFIKINGDIGTPAYIY